MSEAELTFDDTRMQLSGIVTFTNVMRLQKAGKQFIVRHSEGEVECDLTDLHCRDSSILPLLTAWQRNAGKQRIKFSYVNVPMTLRRIGEVCGIDILWTN